MPATVSQTNPAQPVKRGLAWLGQLFWAGDHAAPAAELPRSHGLPELKLPRAHAKLALHADQHGAEVISFDPIRLCCRHCGREWTPVLQSGRLPDYFWQCRRGCNVSQTNPQPNQAKP